MKTNKIERMVVAVLLCFSWSIVSLNATDGVVGTVTNFTQTGSLVVSSWTTSIKATNTAAPFSWRTNVFDADLGRSVFRLTLATNFPWTWTTTSLQKVDTVSICSLTGWDYLPPETDEVRVRLKVVSGHFLLAAGCINLAFSPSDTYTDYRVLDESVGGWQTVRLSLHRNLIRNYRRNDFTKTLPYINITRWIQEPIQLYLFRSGYGELLIDRVEFVSTGLGRPYSVPPPEQITTVAPVADFESTNDMALAFAYSTVPVDLAGPQPTNYSKPNPYTSGTIVVGGKSIQWYLPPRRDRVAVSANGNYSLVVTQRGYESFAFTGVRLPNAPGANALKLTLRADHASTFADLVVDFLAYTAPPDARASFPWTNCQPPGDWLADTNLNFDLFLSEANTWRESYALYHVRRTVTNSQWTTLLLPFTDFTGIYAGNSGTNLLNFAEPLNSSNLLFLGFFSPYRQLKAETQFYLDDLSLVRVAPPVDQLRSFWQNPAVTNCQLIRLTNYANYYGHYRQRDWLPDPMTLGLGVSSNTVLVPVSGSIGQRYEIRASDDLKQWQSIYTGYIGSSDEPLQLKNRKAALFFDAVTD